MSVSVLTPSKGRPQALDLCRRWMREQTIPVEHVVIEGLPLKDAYLRGLPRCSGEWILLADDDDWYGPHYVHQVLETLRLSHATVGGKAYREVYHLRARAFSDQVTVGPLPGTLAFHRQHISDALRCVSEGKSIKYLAPVQAPCYSAPFLRIVGLYDDGISVKHRYTEKRFPKRDPELQWLTRRIGADAVAEYLRVLEEVKSAAV